MQDGTPQTPSTSEDTPHPRTDWQDVGQRIDQLVNLVAPEATEPFDRKLVAELVAAGLKLLPDGRNRGELKLMTAAMKELRYAYRVFGRYQHAQNITIFGSARTPEDHPDYTACVEFSKRMPANWAEAYHSPPPTTARATMVPAAFTRMPPRLI